MIELVHIINNVCGFKKSNVPSPVTDDAENQPRRAKMQRHEPCMSHDEKDPTRNGQEYVGAAARLDPDVIPPPKCIIVSAGLIDSVCFGCLGVPTS